MKTLGILVALVAVTVAKPTGLVYSVIAPYTVSSQYHAQDELGQYSYGYAGGPSAKAEARSLDGITRGGYSYIDSNGLLQSVSYVSDPVNGFRVAATNLPQAPVPAPVVVPQPVQDTPEVSAAKAAHLEAVKSAAVVASEPEPVEVPQPVQDTPEVADAKARHLEAVRVATAAAAAAPEEYSAVVIPGAVTYSAVPAVRVAYSTISTSPVVHSVHSVPIIIH